MPRSTKFFLFLVPIVAFFAWAQVRPKPPGSAGTGTSGSYSSLSATGNLTVGGFVSVDGGIKDPSGTLTITSHGIDAGTAATSGMAFDTYGNFNPYYSEYFTFYQNGTRIAALGENYDAGVIFQIDGTAGTPLAQIGSYNGAGVVTLGTNGEYLCNGAACYYTSRGAVRNDTGSLILRGGSETSNVTALKVYPHTGTTTSSTKLLQMYKDQGTTEVLSINGVGNINTTDGLTVTVSGAGGIYTGARARSYVPSSPGMIIDASTTSAANAVAINIGSRYDFTHLGGKLLSVQDAAVEKAFFDKEGGLGNVAYTDAGTTDTPFGFITIASGASSGSFVASTTNYYRNARCFASITSAPTNPVAVSSCVSDEDKTLNITLTGDPGAAGANVSFYIIRTATPG